MFVFKILLYISLASQLFFSISLLADQHVGKYQLAEKITNHSLQAWDISIFPDGRNLPEGEGDYETGKALYVSLCMACHGEGGKGGIKLDPYRGAIDTLVKKDSDRLTGKHPKKNIGTFWQYAPSLFDYIQRAMPYQQPKSLSNHEVYALTAYLLAENKIISKQTILNHENLAAIKMPNHNGFICDNKIDTISIPCMKDCTLPQEARHNKDIFLKSNNDLKSDCLVPKKIQ